MIRVDSFIVTLPLLTIRIQARAERLWTSTNRYNSLLFIMTFRIQFATIHNYSHSSIKFANYPKDSSCDRPRSVDMQINRSQIDNLRSQKHARKIRQTRLITTDANVHKCIHTNSTMIDDEHILIGTKFTQVLIASTRNLTSGFVRICVRRF